MPDRQKINNAIFTCREVLYEIDAVDVLDFINIGHTFTPSNLNDRVLLKWKGHDYMMFVNTATLFQLPEDIYEELKNERSN